MSDATAVRRDGERLEGGTRRSRKADLILQRTEGYNNGAAVIT
ncbi:hypothetical protein WKK05_41835 (plasmid) [Nostoc sp. UHCC 0302]